MFNKDLVTLRSGFNSVALSKLDKKEYFAINIYEPEHNECFFIDQATGDIVILYKQDEVNWLNKIGVNKAKQIAINEIEKRKYKLNKLDIIFPVQEEQRQWTELEKRLCLSVEYNDKRLAYKLLQREHYRVFFYPKGQNPLEKYVCVLIDKFTGDVIGMQEGAEPKPARKPRPSGTK